MAPGLYIRRIHKQTDECDLCSLRAVDLIEAEVIYKGKPTYGVFKVCERHREKYLKTSSRFQCQNCGCIHEIEEED